MKIQLIHPPVYMNPKALTSLRPAPPLGLAYIAGALLRAGHEVKVLDGLAEAPEQAVPEGRVVRLGLSPEQIVDRILPETEAIGLTNMWSFSWPLVRGLIHILKDRRPDLPLVCGGEHFSGLPEFSMKAAPIDYAVLGEGEDTAVEIFAALESRLRNGDEFDPSKIEGLCYRDGEEIRINPRRKRIRAVDEIAHPAWNLFDLDTYNSHGMKTGIDYGYMVPMLATRGCPYACTYCSSPRMWSRNWFSRSPKEVADEIEQYVKTYGANNFPFQDLTAILKKQWIIDFCKEIIRRELDIRWQLPSGTRCETVDDEVAPLLFESGCRTLCYAPESGSAETRKQVKKMMTAESLFSAIDAAVKQKINLTCFIVLGFPHDKARNIRENFRFARKLALKGVEDVACGFFFPIPATELYDELMEMGRISLDDEALMTPIFVHDRFLTNDRNYSLHLPAWKLTLYRWFILLNFYSVYFVTHPGRIWRVIRNFWRGQEESKLDSFLQIKLANWRRKRRSAT
ncbi:MAG: radical SAM protein [Planctomycetota bacterium]